MMRQEKSSTIDEAYEGLSGLFEELSDISNDKHALYKKYEESLEFIQTHNELSDFNLDEIIKEFNKNSKWPSILINSLMIYSTASGAISTILPELIAQGIIIAGFTAMASMTFVIPAAIALPYFIFKAKEDISKQERRLRSQELILKAKQHLLEKMKDENGNSIKVNLDLDEIDGSWRRIFNSTLLESIYLFGTMFALGIAVLTTFSLSTPLGWALVATGSLIVGIIYSHYHAMLKGINFKKGKELATLEGKIRKYDLKFLLFKSPEFIEQKRKNEILKNNINKLQAKVLALKPNNNAVF